MVRVAIVGLGFMGKTHLGIYSRLGNAEVTAICDIRIHQMDLKNLQSGGNIQTAAASIDLSKVGKYTDLDEMLQSGGFDIVDVTLPTYLHADAVIKSLKAGYHVFCEKPMALDNGECRRMIKTIRQTGKLFSVGQCLRYWPAYSAVKKMIDDQTYGWVVAAEFARFSTPPIWAWDNWLLDGNRSGSAALDLHIHDVDTLLHFFGKPRSVRSSGVFEKSGHISHISSVYDYDGMVVTASGGWKCSNTFNFNMRAFYVMEKATVEMDFSKSPALTVFPLNGEKFSPKLPEGDGYFYELQDFVAGVEKGKLSGLVTAESAAESVSLCLEEIRSAREKKEIKIK